MRGRAHTPAGRPPAGAVTRCVSRLGKRLRDSCAGQEATRNSRRWREGGRPAAGAAAAAGRGLVFGLGLEPAQTPLTSPVARAGQEVTQYTYFQQAGGQALPVPAVEITYGLERILTALQARRCLCLILTLTLMFPIQSASGASRSRRGPAPRPDRLLSATARPTAVAGKPRICCAPRGGRVSSSRPRCRRSVPANNCSARPHSGLDGASEQQDVGRLLLLLACGSRRARRLPRRRQAGTPLCRAAGTAASPAGRSGPDGCQAAPRGRRAGAARAWQGVTHFRDIRYTAGLTYGEMLLQNEYEMSCYNLERADVASQRQLYALYEQARPRPRWPRRRPAAAYPAASRRCSRESCDDRAHSFSARTPEPLTWSRGGRSGWAYPRASRNCVSCIGQVLEAQGGSKERL